MGGINSHASKQLEEIMSVPRPLLHPIDQPEGKGGKSRVELGPRRDRDPLEILNVDRYVSFNNRGASLDVGDESEMLRSGNGNAMVPSHCAGMALEDLDRRETLATA